MFVKYSYENICTAAAENYSIILNKETPRGSSVQSEKLRLNEMAKAALSFENFHTLDETVVQNDVDFCRELDEFYDGENSTTTENGDPQRPSLDRRCSKSSRFQAVEPPSLLRNLRSSITTPSYQNSKAAGTSTTLAESEALLQNESPVGNTLTGHTWPSSSSEPVFDVKLMPPQKYFNPRWNLFWDERDFQKQWSCDWSYNSTQRLLSKSTAPFASSIQSVVGSGSKAAIPCSREQSLPAASTVLPYRRPLDNSIHGSPKVKAEPISIAVQKSEEKVSQPALPFRPYAVPGSVNDTNEPAYKKGKSKISAISFKTPAKDSVSSEGYDISLEVGVSHKDRRKGVPSSLESMSSPKDMDEWSDSDLTHSEAPAFREYKERTELEVVQAIHISGPQQLMGLHRGQVPVIQFQGSPRQEILADAANGINGDKFTISLQEMPPTDDEQKNRLYDTGHQIIGENDGDEEVILINPLLIQSIETQATSVDSHTTFHATPCDTPDAKLKPRRQASSLSHTGPTIPCSMLPPEEGDTVKPSQMPRSLSTQLSPEVLCKKGTKSVFSSPKIVPPTSIPIDVGNPDEETGNPAQKSTQMTAAPTAKNYHSGELPITQENAPLDEDTSRATAVLVNSQDQEILSNPPNATKPNKGPQKKSRPSKSEVEKLFSTTLSTYPLESTAIAPTAVATETLAPPNVQTRAVSEAAKAKRNATTAKKRMRKASIDATTPKTPEKKRRRSKRVGGERLSTK